MRYATLDDITEEDFERYEEVRKSGVTSMYSSAVQDLADISREVHLGIIEHYGALCAKWPHIRNLESPYKKQPE